MESKGRINPINISQNAREVFFLGTFTSGGLEVECADGGLRIAREGKTGKFVAEVDHLTLSGNYARERGQAVLYITERAVFRLDADDGPCLVEIAPGIDLQRDLLAQMSFAPRVAGDLAIMDPALFAE